MSNKHIPTNSMHAHLRTKHSCMYINISLTF